ncbi:MAG: phosphonoacetaldehyde hydrolase [Planctomycetia bacterium]|nr:phosphonoacetaldehyde hydrolase [Planctomycetia bacterium]
MNDSGTTIRAVILDWAGTTIDYGSRAPMQVFMEIFCRRGIEITVAEARGPMGRAKLDHLAEIASLPRVAALWMQRYGHSPQAADVQAMYVDFLPLQKETLRTGSDVIPGIPEAVAELRRMGLAIGSTTGYTRELMDVVTPIAERGGYAPDVIVVPDEVAAGRPAPWLNFRAAELLGVYPMTQVLVVDDTTAGIEAGLHAGSPTVAVTQTGNALGLSENEVARLPAAELESRLTVIERQFRDLGAQHVIRSVAELPELIRRIQSVPQIV